jgi:hypothetical protein
MARPGVSLPRSSEETYREARTPIGRFNRVTVPLDLQPLAARAPFQQSDELLDQTKSIY